MTNVAQSIRHAFYNESLRNNFVALSQMHYNLALVRILRGSVAAITDRTFGAKDQITSICGFLFFQIQWLHGMHHACTSVSFSWVDGHTGMFQRVFWYSLHMDWEGDPLLRESCSVLVSDESGPPPICTSNFLEDIIFCFEGSKVPTSLLVFLRCLGGTTSRGKASHISMWCSLHMKS